MHRTPGRFAAVLSSAVSVTTTEVDIKHLDVSNVRPLGQKCESDK